jgi:excisionase family DNA binding protein
LERKTYRVNEVVRSTGLGRSTIYKLMEEGKLSRIKVGSITLIPAADVDALLRCAA